MEDVFGMLSDFVKPIGYAGGLDDSCRIRWLFIKYAQRTGDPKLLVSTIL